MLVFIVLWECGTGPMVHVAKDRPISCAVEVDDDLERVKFMICNILKTYQLSTFSVLTRKEK